MSVRRSKSKFKTSSSKNRKNVRKTTKVRSRKGYTLDQVKEIQKELRSYDINRFEVSEFVDMIEKKVQPKIPNIYNKRSVKVQMHHADGKILVDGVVFSHDPSSLLIPNFMDYMKDYEDAIDGTPNPADEHFWSDSLYNLYLTNELERDRDVPTSELSISSDNAWIISRSINDSKSLMRTLQMKKDDFKKSEKEYKLYNKLYKGAKADYEILVHKHEAINALVTKKSNEYFGLE